jgi:glucose/mannose-6-phosphate isomerase|tara:strand:- start:2168 stop:3208 length:1041 start_codon:yes stop_codon:yes gene_type:complete
MNKDIDTKNMFGSIWNFPDNIIEAMKIGSSIVLQNNFSKVEKVIVAGMGGSAIGGDVTGALIENELDIPFIVIRGYQLPNWVDDRTLVICSSYSGDTEETLSAFDDAQSKNALICSITTGGTLVDKSLSSGCDVINIPDGLQPRAALAFSFVPMLYLLGKVGKISLESISWLRKAAQLLKDVREGYSIDDPSNPTWSLAQKIKCCLPIIYTGSERLNPVAIRLKGQLCENGKMLAYNNSLPEMNHNEIEGWENNKGLFEQYYIIWLKDKDDHDRVKLRQNATLEILRKNGVKQSALKMKEKSFSERFLHMIHYGDWLSYWCAIAHESDPGPVEKIIQLKKKLASKT